MTDNRKTIVAAGVLAAAVGVYLEISFQDKLKTDAQTRQLSGARSASASAAPSASAHGRPRRPPAP